MKNLAYTLLLASSLFFTSCNKEESVVSPTEFIPEHVLNLPYLKGEIPTSLPYISIADRAKMNASRVAAWTEFGPYTASTTLTKIETNRKMVLAGYPGIPTATYFCDVYISQATATVPTGGLFNLISATKTGFNDVATQSTTPEPITFSQTGTSVVMYTYSVVPRYNLSGQAISYGTLPRDLTGNVFTWSYLKNI